MEEKGYNLDRSSYKLIIARLDRNTDMSVNYEDLKFLFKTHIGESNGNNTTSSKQLDIIRSVKLPNSNIQARSIMAEINTKNSENIRKGNSNSKHSKNIRTKSDRSVESITMPKFLESVLKLENELELLRQNLSLADDFVLKELFYLFDMKSIEKINKDSFLATIKKFNVICTKPDLDLLYRRYDLDDDGFIELI